MFKNMDQIWNSRYKESRGIAKYPFEAIVSIVMSQFGGVKNKQKIRVLDYGCGGGNNLWFLVNEGFDVYALDISEEAFSTSKKNLLHFGQKIIDEDRWVLSKVGDEIIDLPSNYFDAIIDRATLCQSSGEVTHKIVNEFHRMLNPGGIYIGVNFTDEHQDIKYSKYLGNGDYGDFKLGIFKNEGTRHFFNLTELISLFSEYHIEFIKKMTTQMLYGDNKEGEETSEFIVKAQKIKNI